MRFLLPLLLLLSASLSLLTGCEPKENLLTNSGKLSFGAPYLKTPEVVAVRRDTVLFDTVFTSVGTVTKRLWVYNRNARAVRIEQIALGQALASPYSLIINGDETNTAAGLEIRGNDSLLILVKARLGETNANKPFILTDDLKFRTNGNDQVVKLVAYGQNAYFHTLVLGCNEVWKADKPHVITGVALVDSLCTLRIMPGARIYVHAGGSLQVKGTLLINEPEDFSPKDSVGLSNRNIVRFMGDRREAEYAEVPGQWLGIVLGASSHGSRIRYTEIKNSVFGVLLYNPRIRQPQPDLTMNNCVLRNINGANVSAANPFASTGAGVVSVAGTVAATNCLFTNCGQYAILGFGGTKCELNFCTVANYAPGSARDTPALTFTNDPLDEKLAPVTPVLLTIRNSIIWGPTPVPGPSALEDELLLVHAEQYPKPVIEHTLLRTKLYNSAIGTPEKPGFNNNGNILNQDPKFTRTPENYGGLVFDYRLDAQSPASNQGVPLPQAPRDFSNIERDAQKPDLGAFERKKP